MQANRLSATDWTPQHATPPTLRVGILLDEDRRGEIRVRALEPGARLEGVEAPLSAKQVLRVTLASGGVSAWIDDRCLLTAPLIRLHAAPPGPAAAGAGLLVYEVVAGRGFHWQKDIDVCLPATIEFRPGSQGVVLVNELPLEDYLAGVITAEMGAACPHDLLAAQCVVARSWLLAMAEPKHIGEPFDRCNDDCCQRYQGVAQVSAAAAAATRATRGMVLLDPRGDVLDANYSKSCGGVSELPEHVWGVEKPGLSAIVDAPRRELEHRFLPVTEANLDDYLDGRWRTVTRMYCSPRAAPLEDIGQYLGHVDEVDNYFRWTVAYEHHELLALLRDALPEVADWREVLELRVTARGVSGRATSVVLRGRTAAGEERHARIDTEYRIRQVLHRRFLYSSAFAVRSELGLGGRLVRVTLRGAGWGHGVGMCQIGALGMALAGIDYRDICAHYYPAATLARVYD